MWKVSAGYLQHEVWVPLVLPLLARAHHGVCAHGNLELHMHASLLLLASIQL